VDYLGRIARDMSFTRLERRKTLIERWQLVSPYVVQVNLAGVLRGLQFVLVVQMMR
jgi:hypothetical protein